MTLRTITLAASLAFTLPIGAQTQLLRGDVDSISGSNRFQLDCTNIEIFSNTVNLQQLHNASHQQDIDYEMQVRPGTFGGRFALEVVSAVQIPEQFEMGNLRFNRSESWEAFAAPGTNVFVFVNVPSASAYLPVGPAGTWLIGNAVPFMQGTTGSTGRFQQRITMPTIPALVGTTFNAQAIFQNNGTFSITAPDCKEVRND